MSKYGTKVPAARAQAVAQEILYEAIRIAVARYGVNPLEEKTWNCCPAGSLRRGREMVGDIDFVVDGTDPRWVEIVLDALQQVAGPDGLVRTQNGRVKGAVIGGVNVELYVSKADAYGGMLLYATGSGVFNVWMRSVAARRGLFLSQYGLFKATRDGAGKRVPGELIEAADEARIFAALGLPFVDPVQREDPPCDGYVPSVRREHARA